MIAFVAQWLVLLPAVLVVVSVVGRRRWKTDVIEAAVGGLVTILFVKFAGSLVVEQRPFVVEHLRPLVAHAADNAFPSDHLAACGLAFTYLFSRSKLLAFVTLASALAIGYARVAAHLHWPIDVIAGFILGASADGIVRFGLPRSSAARR